MCTSFENGKVKAERDILERIKTLNGISAYEEGINAGRRKKSRDTNPYPKWSMQYKDWDFGWVRSQQV